MCWVWEQQQDTGISELGSQLTHGHVEGGHGNRPGICWSNLRINHFTAAFLKIESFSSLLQGSIYKLNSFRKEKQPVRETTWAATVKFFFHLSLILALLP